MDIDTRPITDDEHEELMRSAVHVDPFQGQKDPQIGGDVYKHTVKKKIFVPVEKEVQVPVSKKTVETRLEQHVVKGTQMVPVKKYKDITETTIETREEVVESFKERWVKIKEPTREVVKKQVPVTRTRMVPYTEYVEEDVQEVVEVPKDVIKETKGFRIDKHIGTKVVEVEEDHHYEMQPVYLKKGDQRARETNEIQQHGKMEHGESVFEERKQVPYIARVSQNESKSSAFMMNDQSMQYVDSKVLGSRSYMAGNGVYCNSIAGSCSTAGSYSSDGRSGAGKRTPRCILQDGSDQWAYKRSGPRPARSSTRQHQQQSGSGQWTYTIPRRTRTSVRSTSPMPSGHRINAPTRSSHVYRMSGSFSPPSRTRTAGHHCQNCH